MFDSRHLLAAICIVALVSCAATGEAPKSDERQVVSPRVDDYLEEVLTILQRESLFTAETDWGAVREELFNRAAGARETRETYVAIADSLRLIDDHSLIVDPEFNYVRPSSYVKRPRPFMSREPRAELLGSRVLYLYIPRHSPKSLDESRGYVAKIRSSLDRSVAGCGIIVDLRGNTGGNMWPMIEALAPILNPGPAGRLGAWLDGKGEVLKWWGFRGGRSFEGDAPLPDYFDDQPVLSAKPAPVAILIGKWTRSSGEMTAVAFRGRPDAVFIGQESGGFLTGNEDFQLSDGAIIALAFARTADRFGAPAGESLVPDIEIEPHATAVAIGEDRAVSAARAWIKGQSGCRQATSVPGR